MRKPGLRTVAYSAALAMLLAGAAHAATYTVNVTCTGAQEIPANGSTAVGTGTLTIDDVANTVTYNITHNVVGATASHIHGPAARDKNAGVLVGFPSGTSPIVGVANTSPANIAAIKSGRTYVNIHSGAFGAGEIRGQVPAAPGTAPGVGTWGMIALATGLLGAGIVWSRRRNATA